MVIKSGKENIIGLSIFFISITGMFISGIYEVGVFYSGFVCFYPFLLFFKAWISIGRTFTMDEEGCTVCFLWYKKKYRWENLYIKRIEHYYNIPGDQHHYYTDAAVFSVHAIHKPKWWHAYSYSWHVHPFSFFFVYFPLAPDIRKKVGKPLGGTIYEVNEEMFLEKLKSWNVELEDTRVRRRRRR